jgi:seryl-tRNA synthetase
MKKKTENASAKNVSKFITQVVQKLNKDIESASSTIETADEAKKLKTLRESLIVKRDDLQKEIKKRKKDSHAKQASQLIEQLDVKGIKTLFQDEFPIFSISQINANTPGINKKKKKFNG